MDEKWGGMVSNLIDLRAKRGDHAITKELRGPLLHQDRGPDRVIVRKRRQATTSARNGEFRGKLGLG